MSSEEQPKARPALQGAVPEQVAKAKGAELQLDLERAELSTEPTLSSEAGLTAQAARQSHGYADDALSAGFISKQTPLEKRGK